MNILGFEFPPREVEKEVLREGVVDRIGSYTASIVDSAWTVFVLTLVGEANVYELKSRASLSGGASNEFESKLALTRQGDKVSIHIRQVHSFEGALLRTEVSDITNHSFDAVNCVTAKAI
ncbi:hypothetical protein [Ralstonia pseudosolanacearum]|uniref:hypothetical protein n=1 Tax=Ralstonia pseudosolanacearum TaxID=1310165 RepID=UPI003CE90496